MRTGEKRKAGRDREKDSSYSQYLYTISQNSKQWKAHFSHVLLIWTAIICHPRYMHESSRNQLVFIDLFAVNIETHGPDYGHLVHEESGGIHSFLCRYCARRIRGLKNYFFSVKQSDFFMTVLVSYRVSL